MVEQTCSSRSRGPLTLAIFVSGTDPVLARILGAPMSQLPERYGGDVIAGTPRGLAVFQRKQFPHDFLASVGDDRIAREIPLLKRTQWPVFIIEGRAKYTTDGYLYDEHLSGWEKRTIRNLIRSLWWKHGIRTEFTEDIEDTADAIREIVDWMHKPASSSLLRRNKMQSKDEWGYLDQIHWGQFFLQGFPGIGADRAAAIIRHFQGIPLEWTVDQEELEKVFGIGPLIAKEICRLLPPQSI
jgi:DNA excision repair protein ERCC-4